MIAVYWLSAGLAIGCLVVGLLHLARLVTLRQYRLGEASSAAMALGMAAMFSPLGNPVPESLWTAVFLAFAAWSAVLAVRARSIGGDVGHHLLCSGAMIFMMVGHSAHGGAGGLGAASVAALVLAGYFAWHGLRCVDRFRIAESGPRTVAVAHLVTTVAMSGMLIAMV